MRRSVSFAVVVATVLVGTVASISSTQAAVPVAAAGSFVSVNPTRLLDTRSGVGSGKVAAHGTVKLAVVGGSSPVPAGATGVVLNVTVTQPATSGYVTIWADGTPMPKVSSLNFVAGQTVPNLVFAPLSAAGKVDLNSYSAGTIQLIADVFGYFAGGTPTNAGAYATVTPTRLIDTRSQPGAPGPDGTLALRVAGGSSPVPAGVTSVVLNVTVTLAGLGGSLTVWADGTPRPTSSSLNFNPKQSIPNLVVAPVGADGMVDFYNSSNSTIQVIADVSGYFIAGTPSVAGTYKAIPSKQVLSTRTHVGGNAPVSGGTVNLAVAGVSPIPAGVPAVMMNVAATGSQAGGYIIIYPDLTTRPLSSNLNFSAGQTISNAVLAKLGTNGYLDFYNASAGTTQLNAHVAGYFLAAPTT